jgi:pyruvate dehydrogenase E2 component (dihydrolipoamide acetyltransferase)
MATKVHMEALSPTMEEGQVVKWLKAEGDAVSHGEILAEIETDKATMELVARGDGVLRKILVEEGGTAPVGEVIALIAGADEELGDLAVAGEGETAGRSPDAEAEGEESGKGEEEPGDGPRDEAPGAGEVAAEDEPVEKKPTGAQEGERVKASPLARRLAQEGKLDLSGIEGTGPGGRVVRRDVEAAMNAGREAEAEVAAPPPSRARAAVDGPEFEDVPLSQMRKTIARRLVESLGPVPHFFLRITVDMSRILEARERVNGIRDSDDGRISINDFILKSTAAALARHPEVNSHWSGDSIRRFRRVHLGVAVATEEGLITPVIRDADVKGLAEISRELRELAARGREKKLQPEEYTGSTFSVSNLGMFGIHEFTGVINPPEAGIVAVGGVEETPVVEDGQVVVRPLMKVTMSCDHRVIDGATGARFLRTLKRLLEEPAAALL